MVQTGVLRSTPRQLHASRARGTRSGEDRRPQRAARCPGQVTRRDAAPAAVPGLGPRTRKAGQAGPRGGVRRGAARGAPAGPRLPEGTGGSRGVFTCRCIIQGRIMKSGSGAVEAGGAGPIIALKLQAGWQRSAAARSDRGRPTVPSSSPAAAGCPPRGALPRPAPPFRKWQWLSSGAAPRHAPP